MATKKSLQRRVAEQIAKADAIKIKSAQRRIQRAAKANKPVKAPESLSSYYRKLFREVVKEKKEKPVRAPEPAPAPEPIYEPIYEPDRADFDFDGVELFSMEGRFELGSSGSKDIRDRKINHLVTADQLNKILNAETADKAAAEFSKIVGYVADVRDLRGFTFKGKSYGKDFFE